MALLEWNNDLSVGVNSFDAQHKRLIEIFNTFYQSIVNRDSKEKIESVIKGLKEYTVHHFKDEEAYMKVHQFPGYAVHKADHDKFVKSVQELEERFKSGKLILSLEVINLIRNWITQHILDIDKQYTKFMVEKGVR